MPINSRQKKEHLIMFLQIQNYISVTF